MKKAKVHANVVLPAEPQSLVEQYLEGKERPLKEQVVSNRKSHFSTPALPTNKDRGQDISLVLVKANVRQESVTAGEWKCCVTVNENVKLKSV